MKLIRNIHQRPTARAIVRSMVQLCASLDITVIAEGIETVEEYDVVRDCGIHLMQGYLLAKPGFECLPDFKLPGVVREAGALAVLKPVALPQFVG